MQRKKQGRGTSLQVTTRDEENTESYMVGGGGGPCQTLLEKEHGKISTMAGWGKGAPLLL